MNKTSYPAPAAATRFSLPTRIYYEDTDAAGVVYYANYLKYFERGRAEWLRAIGHDQRELAREHNIAFVVRSVQIDYKKPARLDDVLDIELAVDKVGGAQVVFRQAARRRTGGEVEDLVVAAVQIVCVNLGTMKSTPIPGWLRDKLEELQ